MSKKALITKVVITLSMVIMLVANIQGEEPPAWYPLGDLPSAIQIWDIIEIPGPPGMDAILIACGKKSGDNMQIWRSLDRGTTWELSNIYNGGWGCLMRLVYDSTINALFSVGYANGYYTVRYSTDYGSNWYPIAHPVVLREADAIDAVILDHKLYVAYNYWSAPFGLLFRLDISSSDPGNWTWEFVMQYPQITEIQKLLVKDGKLYVFGKDRDNNAIRVFTYDPGKLDHLAKRIGTIKEVEARWKSVRLEPETPGDGAVEEFPVLR